MCRLANQSSSTTTASTQNSETSTIQPNEKKTSIDPVIDQENTLKHHSNKQMKDLFINDQTLTMTNVKISNTTHSELNIVPNSNTNEDSSSTFLQNLLEVSTPRLETKLVNLLLKEDTIRLFMAYITRVPDSDLSPKNLTLMDRVNNAQHKRNWDDLDATKRSYHAMEILTGSSSAHFSLQDGKFELIITCLFDIFAPTSDGNFNHFAKIFQHFVRRHPVDMLDLLYLQQPNDNATWFFDCMLPYIHESAVMDSILAIIFVRDINVKTKEKRQAAHTRLSELRLVQWLVKAIEMNNLAFSEAAGELLIRIIEEASLVDNGHLLLQVLDRPDQGGKDIMEVLVKLVENHRPSQGRNRVVKILLLLTKSGLLATRAAALSHPIHGPLYAISVNCQEMLSNHIPQLCSVISNDRQSFSTKQLPLTIYDLDLLDVIYSTLPNIRNRTDLIDAIPTAFWRIVVNSFFEKSTSSIYHALFYRIFCMLLELRHEPLIISLIRRQKLVTRMVDMYEDKEQGIDTRGYILLVLNYLRLMTDAEPTGVLHRIMTNHPRYCQFLPTLRADTLAQIKFNYTWKLDSCPRPPTHIGPSPPIRSAPYSSFTPTLQLTEDADDYKESDGIDLGSDYAYCMGFDQKPQPKDDHGTAVADVITEPPSIDTNTDGFADLWWGESLTADDPYDSAY